MTAPRSRGLADMGDAEAGLRLLIGVGGFPYLSYVAVFKLGL